MRVLAGIVATVVLVVGCDESVVVSEGEDFSLVLGGVRTETLRGWEAPYRVLTGTVMCPQVQCAACDGSSCGDVALAASGPVHVDETGCFVADAPGEIEWRVGAPCDDLAAPRDRAMLRVVGVDEVAAEAVLWPDRALAAAAGFAAGGAAFHAEDEPLPTPLAVVEGSQVQFAVRMYTRGDERVVGWSDGAVTLRRDEGRAPVAYPGERLELVTFADATATAEFAAGGGTWPLGQVRGVAADTVKSLRIAAAAQVEGGAPALARAVARDADGVEVFGLPVTWTVRSGELALVVDPDLPGQDYVWLGDVCLPPERRGGPRSAVIEARYGGISAELELTWIGEEGVPEPDWERDSSCPEGQGCGCRASEPGFAWVGLLGLLRRRRGAVPERVTQPAAAREAPRSAGGGSP